MHKSILFRTKVASALLYLTLFASCSADNEPDNTLPEGKYPITFTTDMEGLTQTRATPEGTWESGERISIRVEKKSEKVSVKQYTTSTSGQKVALTGVDADNTFYWHNTSEEYRVIAWYSGNDSYTTDTDQLPTTFTTETDQSGEGYRKSDFLCTMKSQIIYNYKNPTLHFYHLPSQIIINLKNGDGVTADDVKDANVRLINMHNTSGKIVAEKGMVLQIGGTGDVEIIPKKWTTAKEGWQQSVQALIVPQEKSNVPFIKVTIGKDNDKRDYYYVLQGDTDFLYMSQYTFNITVMKTGLSVEPVSIGEWTDQPIESGQVNKAKFKIKLSSGPLLQATLKGIKVTADNNSVYETTGGNSFSFSYTTSNRATVPVFTIEKGMATGAWTEISNNDGTTTYTYTCTNIRSDLWINHLAAGYYYYADGTWSSEYTAGGPACIGIVFWVGDATEKDATLAKDHPDCTHGLVVALKDAIEETAAWQSSKSSVQSWLDNNRMNVYLSVESGSNSGDPAVDNIQGYNNTKAIEEFNTANKGNIVEVVVKAAEYRKKVSAPTNSSGWYLPSMQELTLLYGFAPDKTTNLVLINGKLSSISSVATTITLGNYWSSTEKNNGNAYYMVFNLGGVGFCNKDQLHKLRCVLAF